MTKPQLLRIIDKKDLKKVPNKFSLIISDQQIGKTLILIDGDENRVLTSKELSKILKKVRIKEDEQYVLVTINLTTEAIELLEEREIEFVQDRDFVWTDEQYKQREKRRHEFLNELRQRKFEEQEHENSQD